MQHARLLGILFGFLVMSAGGVLALVLSEDKVAEIPPEALVAGPPTKYGGGAGTIEKSSEKKAAEANEVFEAELQTEQQASLPSLPSPSLPPPPPPSPAPSPDPAPPAESPDVSAEALAEEEGASSPPSPAPSSQPVGKIDINTANSEALQQLHGIGPVLASRIIDYRNTTSLFYAVEDLKNVNGIGEATFEKIKSDITVGNVSPPPAPAPAPSPAPSPLPPTSLGCEEEQVDINSAPQEELVRIIHIGESRAQNLISLRPFSSLDDLKRVSGIGETRLADMKEQGLACVN